MSSNKIKVKVIGIAAIYCMFSGFTTKPAVSPVMPEQSIYLQQEPVIPQSYYEIKISSLTEPSNLTPEQLEKGLLGELKRYAYLYVEMEETYGVNAVFLAAKDALESGWGKYSYGNNLSGWGNRTFSSHEECIREVSRLIKMWYLTPPHDEFFCDESCDYDCYGNCLIGQYYNGYTVADVNCSYNGREFWEDEVSSIMYDIYERIDKN